MKSSVLITIFILSLNFFSGSGMVSAQGKGSKSAENKERKRIQQTMAYSRIDSLINSQQFIFNAAFGEGKDLVFVVVDSLFAEVQNGNRNNLMGRVTDFQVRKNDKKQNFYLTIKMRGDIYSGDIFLFIGPYGDGTATVKCEFPGNFTFSGNLVDYETANIYEGRSHFIY